jgi:large subunit ribosomal protein L18
MDLKSAKKSGRKVYRRARIKLRIRKIVSGTADKPRLSVFRSNKDIYAQVIDDDKGVTLLSASSREKGITDKKVTKTEKAKLVGNLIAERAKEAGLEGVVFDRNGYLYHGRVKSLAEAAREGGLKF